MFAIIEVGGKQHRVTNSDIIEVEKLKVDSGKEVILDKVLLFCAEKEVKIGQPYLKDVKVIAQVLGQFKAKKVISFKYRRRKASHSKIGHRQQLTRLKIKEIKSG